VTGLLNNRILPYINEFPRNRIVISNHALRGFDYINVGYELARLAQKYEFEDSGYRLVTEFENMIRNSVSQLEPFGNVIALENIGFLLDERLNFSLRSFLERNSQNQLIVLNWNGEIENNEMCFLTRESGIRIDLKRLNYLRIQDEV
jgi:hypothetical protein